MHVHRPRGVVALAAYYAVVSWGIVLAAAIAVFVLRLYPRFLIGLAPYPEALFAVVIAVGVFHGATAYGVWTLRLWARWFVVVLSLLSIVFGMLTLPFGLAAVLLNVATVWYVNEPRIRAMFRRPATEPPEA